MTVFSDALTAILHDQDMKIAATLGTATIYGNFENSTVVIDGVETKAPTFDTLDTDLTGVKHGDHITIASVTYHIIGIEPNGKGSTLLILRKD